MQCDPCVAPSCVPTCCATSVIFSVSTVDSSPIVNPFKMESLTTALCASFSTPIFPTCVGSADQNTMLPAAPTGAMRNFTVVTPAPCAWTVTVTYSICTLPASANQMFLGSAQVSPLA